MLAASLEQEDIKRLDDILVEMKAEEVVATLADRLTEVEVETFGDTLAEVVCKHLSSHWLKS